ncbi:hypothetical protein BC833DRAFT_573620 [Globomyces pollinis-pini]|nr:hypothetical protein BC833DRAFT_573620 [Globomyces pollinis-pini]
MINPPNDTKESNPISNVGNSFQAPDYDSSSSGLSPVWKNNVTEYVTGMLGGVINDAEYERVAAEFGNLTSVTRSASYSDFPSDFHTIQSDISQSNSQKNKQHVSAPQESPIHQSAFKSSTNGSVKIPAPSVPLFDRNSETKSQKVDSLLDSSLPKDNTQTSLLERLSKKHNKLLTIPLTPKHSEASNQKNNNNALGSTSNSKTMTHLQELSKKIVAAGFNPIHSSLLTISDSIQPPKDTLTESQGLYLMGTLSVLYNEYMNKESTIQQLLKQVNENQKPNNNIFLDSNVDSNAQNRIAELTLENQRLKALNVELNNENKKLNTFVESGKPKAKNESFANYNIANPNNHFDDISDYSIPLSSYGLKLESDENQSKDRALKILQEELAEVKRQKEILQLQLVNSKKDYKPPMGPDVHGLTTRERIQRDKKIWKLQSQNINGLTQLEATEQLKEICEKLGITDYENIGQSIDKIQLVFRLVPQMQRFIQQINATVKAYTIHADNSNTSLSMSSVNQPLKLEKSLAVIREWAELAASKKDQQAFINDVHEQLDIVASPASYEKCLVAIERLVNSHDRPQMYPHIPVDQAQQWVNYFQQLFGLKSLEMVRHKMDSLYIFSTEMEHGLLRIKEVLKLDGVSPGRVLFTAADILEKHKLDSISGSMGKLSTSERPVKLV